MPRLQLVRLAITTTILAAQLAGAQTLPLWKATRDLVLNGTLYEFGSNDWVRADDAGRIHVAERQSLTIRVFDSTGGRVRTMGGRGKGPGELTSLSMTTAGFFGDSLWVAWEYRNVNVYAPSGRAQATMVLPYTRAGRLDGVEMPMFRTVRILGRHRDGAFLVHASPSSAPDKWPKGYDSTRHPILLVDAKGRTIKALTWLPWGEDIVQGTRDRFTLSTNIPFPNPTRYAVSVDARHIVVAHADISGPAAGMIDIRRLGADGEVVAQGRYPASMREIPPRVVDSAFAQRGAWATGQRNPALVKALSAAPRPRYYPHLRNLYVARDGSTLLEFTTDGAEREYLILDTALKPVARFRLPAAVNVSQFEGRSIWGNNPDADRIDSVVRYRVGP